jgi:hypothetical protein
VVLGKFWDNIVLDVVKSVKKAMDGLNTEVKTGVQKTLTEVNAMTEGGDKTDPQKDAPKKEHGGIKGFLGISQIAEGR